MPVPGSEGRAAAGAAPKEVPEAPKDADTAPDQQTNKKALSLLQLAHKLVTEAWPDLKSILSDIDRGLRSVSEPSWLQHAAHLAGHCKDCADGADLSMQFFKYSTVNQPGKQILGIVCHDQCSKGEGSGLAHLQDPRRLLDGQQQVCKLPRGQLTAPSYLCSFAATHRDYVLDKIRITRAEDPDCAVWFAGGCAVAINKRLLLA